MKELVEYIVKAIVDNPGDVNVSLDESEIGKVIKIKVADNDKGRVIGKEGRIIKAIRQVVSAGAAKNGERYKVEITE